MRTARGLLVVLLLACVAPVLADATPPPKAIPPLLTPWIPWVLEDAGKARCPAVDGVRVCVWPSALSVALADQRAEFTLRVTTERAQPVTLPGARGAWPVEVKVDGKRVPVLERDGLPEAELTRGTHTITGVILFGAPPAKLTIPANVGALSVSVNGRPLLRPRREASGLVWLSEPESARASEPRVYVSVHRRIEDAVPLRVVTRIELSVTGEPGELTFPGVLLAGTRPIAVHSELPAELAHDGSLHVQAGAGSFRIELRAILESPPESLRAPALPAPWPAQEVWVFAADDELRHVELAGPPQVDSARTDLASDWQGLPTFLVTPETPLRFETRRRGEPEPAPNRFTLQRTLWLDVDGVGYTVRDHVRGALRQGFRLELRTSTLGRAEVAGATALVTLRGEHTGVELRARDVDVVTEFRLEEASRELPAVGYDSPVEQLGATLHLPPGYRLLAAQGVDALRGSWFDSWDLFDFFFVLLLSLAVAKLAGRWFGVVALLALVLSQHEPHAPVVTWAILLVATALTRVLRRGNWGHLARALWGFSLLLLLLVLLPFATDQVREALHPQLAQSAQAGLVQSLSAPLDGGGGGEEHAQSAPAPPRRPAADRAEERPEQAQLRSRKSSLKQASSDSYSVRNLVDPAAVVQTGPGVPSWSFSSYALHWTGPVAAGARLKLWLLPPLATRTWSLLAALLSGALLFALVRAARLHGEPPGPPSPEEPPSMGPPAASGSDSPRSSAAALSALLLALSGVGTASAEDVPSPALLDALRERLLATPACAPSCASVPSLRLSLDGQRLEVSAEVHAGEAAVVRAPGPLASWSVDSIRIDGRDALGAARLDDGFLYVRLPPGIHALTLSGPVPPPGAWTLALTQPAPQRVEARASGWTIEGLHADGTAEESLELQRTLPAQAAGGTPDQALTHWLEVRRELELGLRFRITTTLTRLGPTGEAVLVRLPLLEGESVHEPGLREERGSVVVSIPSDQRAVTLASSLAARERVVLVAAQPSEDGVLKHPYSETWRVRPSTLYHVAFDGIPPVTRFSASGVYTPEFRPFPGERLLVRAERLLPAPGSSVTIDRAELRFEPGARMEQSTLSLSLRASRGTTETIAFPRNAELAALSVNGKPHPARLKRGVLKLPLPPGTHAIELTLHRPLEFGLRYAPPVPKLARPATNVFVNITLPRDRWLLWTSGPSWGPAILFWGYAAAILLISLALGRIPWSPLRTYQWALLGLGLTQVEPLCALIVVGWLFALAYRDREVIEGRRLFNLVQTLLVLFTLAALWCLAYAVHQGLLVPPDMQVQGMMSNQNFVQWYADRTHGQLPEVTVWSAPIWVYKGLMLLWALWLAASLIQWLHFGWVALRKGGAYRANPNARKRSRRRGMSGRHGDPPPDAPASGDGERAGVS